MKKIILTATTAVFSTIVLAQTDSASFYFQKAMEEKTKGRHMEVVKALEKAEKFKQNEKQVVAELADAYLSVRLLAKARDKYLQLETMGAADGHTYRQLMQLAFNMRQFPDAIRYAQLVQKQDPAAKLSYIVGRAYYEMEDLGNGVKHLELAAKEDPENAQVPHLLATAYANMQNFRQAISYFQKAIALEPSNARYRYELALTYYGLGDDQNALKYMLEAGEKGYKKDNEYMQNLSMALMNAGKSGEAIEMMKQTLARRPGDIALMDMIAEACYDAGKWDEAISFYNQILTVDEKKAEAMYMMGMAYQKKGQVQNGRAICDKAIAMDPKLSSLKQEKKMPGGM